MKTAIWQLQDAKAHFSELVNKTLTEGAQTITKHGQEAVVIISAAEYHKLTKPSDSLIDFFRSAPSMELDIQRSKDTGRNVEL